MKIIAGHTQVAGRRYTIVHDYINRSTYAIDDATQERKTIRHGHYLGNDLTIRKEIARTYQLATFRKTAPSN